MQNILLISEGLSISFFKKFDFSSYGVVHVSAQEVQVISGENYVIFEPGDLSDYSDQELNMFPFSSPQAVQVRFNDLILCNRTLICSLNGSQKIFVDNDHGMVLDNKQFYDQLQANPNWDWRKVESI